MIKVLVTGGCGYIGSTYSKYTWCSPTIFDNLMYDQGPLVFQNIKTRNIPFYRENVLDWSDNLKYEISKADVIIPLAAFVGAPLCDRFYELSWATNYGWFEKLLPYLNKQLVIYPNSNSAYGTVEGVCTEETPINPLSEYAKSKQKTEDLLLKNYPNTIVFRLATVFGWSPRPRLDLLINSLVYEAVTTKKLKIFDGNNNRNYVHVEDISKAFNFAIWNQDRMKGQVFNLGNDSINMSKLQLATKIAELTNTTIELDESKTDPDQRNYLVSSQKLYSLGYNTRVSLEEGIKEIIKFCSLINDPNARYIRNY